MPKRLLVTLLWTVGLQAQRVEGRVINSLTGGGIAWATVELVRAASTSGVAPDSVEQTITFGAATGRTAYSATTDAQGRFRIEEIREGAYTVRYRAANYWNEVDAPGVREVIRLFQVTAGGNPVKLEARMIPMASISGRVVDGRGQIIPKAQLDLIESTSIAGLGTDADGRFSAGLYPGVACGKVVMEAPMGQTAPQPPQVRLTPVVPDDLFEPPLMAWPEADGSFNLEYVYAGAYRLAQVPLRTLSAYYLDAVRLGEAEVAAPQMQLVSAAVPLTLVYKADGGTVRGTVEDCASGGVVLVAADPAARWPGLEHRARCDAQGRYELTALRPGEYYALAFPPAGQSPAWPERYDDALLNQASRVTVRAGEVTAADLRLVARAP